MQSSKQAKSSKQGKSKVKDENKVSTTIKNPDADSDKSKASSCEPSSSITEVSRDSIIFPRYCRIFLFFFFFWFSATIYQKSTPTINARCRFFCSFVFYFFFYLKLQINTIFSFEMTKNIHKFFFIINIIITNFA